MIGTKCPGQDMRYWTSDDVYEEKCPECGGEVEFFKTDIRLRCPNCKTRVANPRFNMGCAEWCAYAEQCLGPGAKGLKKGSLKSIFLKELDNHNASLNGELEDVRSIIEKTEERLESERKDILPVLAAIVILFLKKNKLIEDIYMHLEKISIENSVPQKAVKDIQEILGKIDLSQLNRMTVSEIKENILEVL